MYTTVLPRFQNRYNLAQSPHKSLNGANRKMCAPGILDLSDKKQCSLHFNTLSKVNAAICKFTHIFV